jgi:hypothetical protein
MSVLVLIEADGGTIVPTSADPLALGVRLAERLGTEVVSAEKKGNRTNKIHNRRKDIKK